MFNHVMLDIETLGQGANAQITSIAAVEFDIVTGKHNRTFHEHVNIKATQFAKFDLEPDTILWWLGQSKAAQDAFLEGQKKSKSISEVLANFKQWFDIICRPDDFVYIPNRPLKSADTSNVMIWGRGPRFDMGILSNAYTKNNVPIPWDFRNERCVRTIEWLAPDIKNTTSKVDITGHGSDGGGLHDGLLDALYQVKYVSNIYQHTNILF